MKRKIKKVTGLKTIMKYFKTFLWLVARGSSGGPGFFERELKELSDDIRDPYVQV